MIDRYVEDIGYLYDLADVILITDSKGKIEYYKVFRSLGTRICEDPVGMNILDLHQHLKKNTSTVMKVIEKGEPIINELQALNIFKERTVKVLTSTFPIRDGEEVIGAIEIDRYHDPDVRRLPVRKRYGSAHNAYFTIDDVVTEHPVMKDLLQKTRRAARTSSPVMIWGETGTGKELFAQSVHNHSFRRTNAFVSQNCSAIPLTLGESIFFGTTSGSFTGAEDKMGLFEMAHEGTLLLDEINSMDIQLQSKLLRATESRSIRKIGGVDSINVDVRLITTLNEDPQVAMERGVLRRDLFYRLAVVFMKLLPLRERRGDIPLLVKHFVDNYNHLFGTNIKGVHPSVENLFMDYSWPGNVRELKHVIESSFNLATGDVITLEDLPPFLFSDSWNVVQQEIDLNKEMERFEKNCILKALSGSSSLKETAKKLSISRQSLRYKLDSYGLSINKK